MRCSLPVAPFGISSRKTIFARHLEVGQPLGGEVAQLALGRRHALAQHDGGGDLLAQLRVRHGERHAPAATAGWSISTSSTSSGRDLLAAAVDDLLEPPGERQVAVRVEHALVAGAEPAVGEGLGVGLRVVLVARRDVAARGSRSRRSSPGGRSVAVLVHDGDLGPGGDADACPACAAPGGSGLLGHLVRGLGHAVGSRSPGSRRSPRAPHAPAAAARRTTSG